MQSTSERRNCEREPCAKGVIHVLSGKEWRGLQGNGKVDFDAKADLGLVLF